MNKKGFTLVELLAVLIILAIILAIVFPAVNDIVSESNNTMSNVQINKILDATYDYSLKNINKLPESGDTIYITLNELKKDGFIDSDIKDIISNDEYPNNLVISIKNVGTNYKYNKEYSKVNGNYLYTVEAKFMNQPEFTDNMPDIILDGYEESLVETIDINSDFVEPSYIATSYEGVDLTDKVIKNIIYKSKNTDKVDTSKAGIYYINYAVVDSKGYSTVVVLSVIITDEELPILTVPENITISASDTEFDLNEGVSCIDNSGQCKIKINGDIKFGTVGKYTIEYVGTDPSGNTVTDRRIITVE